MTGLAGSRRPVFPSLANRHATRLRSTDKSVAVNRQLAGHHRCLCNEWSRGNKAQMRSAYYLPPLTPPQEVLWTFLIGAGGLFSLAAVIAFYHGQGRKMALSLFSGIAGLAFGMGFITLLESSGATFLQFYAPMIFSSTWIALVAGILAMLLFAIRKISLGTYAAIEISGAVSTLIVVGANSFGSATQRASALLTAIYFLIRGLDNAEKAMLHLAIGRAYLDWKSRPLKYKLTAAVPLLAPSVLLLPNPDRSIVPPYASGIHGGRLPVSAIHCGSPIVFCDEAAWHEHERLLRGSAEDRARAELEAEKRGREQDQNRRPFWAR